MPERREAIYVPKNPKERLSFSPLLYYNCSHGAHNIPCVTCFPGKPIMPLDWMKTYRMPSNPLTQEGNE